jgi:protein-S-isoprenylcysteine O-methyltransferase Ste14
MPVDIRLGRYQIGRMRRRLFAVLRTIVVGALFVSIWVWFLPRYVAGADAFHDARPPGWIVIACGVLITAACAWEFAWRGLGTPAPFDPPRKLVVSGLYRWMRNPMYVGLGLMLIGEGITFPRLTRMMLVLVPLLGLALTGFITGYEEPALRRTFGSDYEEYCRNVRRWLPRRTPFDKGSSAAVTSRDLE